MSALVQLENVAFNYTPDSPILNNINFEIENNTFVTILGPSGCGKSTLLNLIAGFIPTSNGSIKVDEKHVKAPSEERGFVFQDLALFPWLSVYKNVEFGLKMQNIPKEKRDQKVKEMIELVGLSSYSNFPISSLSGGMKQRVALARTLATEPNILLLDEPFSALDAQTRDVLQEELLALHQKLSMTTMLVTHSIDEAIYLSDTIILLSKNGTIKEIVQIDIDKPRDRTSSSYNDYQKKLYEFLRNERQQS
ncbi:ABC transporter ATP-binding protein [Halalkalibacter nanhaiisediminis]|uniref:NitT/TauT family transport system ATP-binding protein n=1 Tax=Halalkalibacter nanhaiisediminis TaxID=688079 RepID=A0A562QMF7_9BACI|nr:ABC transporter ATP-binding protein [Halalkalibacter nanhaiisediminis]TWI57941.1 NitT/TauT family transport system ATP-binding protein [Halalkalibacter nanhaiisediminis]